MQLPWRRNDTINLPPPPPPSPQSTSQFPQSSSELVSLSHLSWDDDHGNWMNFWKWKLSFQVLGQLIIIDINLIGNNNILHTTSVVFLRGKNFYSHEFNEKSHREWLTLRRRLIFWVFTRRESNCPENSKFLLPTTTIHSLTNGGAQMSSWGKFSAPWSSWSSSCPCPWLLVLAGISSHLISSASLPAPVAATTSTV